MQAKPDGWKDGWRPLLKRQLVVIFCGAFAVIVTGLTNRLMASDLMRVEAKAEVDATEAFGWESFEAMVHYYEDRVDALEAELQACREP